MRGKTKQINVRHNTRVANPLTMQQEQFCVFYIETGSANDAYRKAYGEGLGQPTVSARCNALLKQPMVIKRLETLRHRHQVRNDISITTLTNELEEARLLAMSLGKPGEAISATMGKAKLHGLLINRSEVKLKRPEDMTIEELKQVLSLEFEQDLAAGNGLAIEHSPIDDDSGDTSCDDVI